MVCAARDEETKSLVAIKKITNAFEHTTYTKRTLREIRLLRLLQHEVIPSLTPLPDHPAEAYMYVCVWIERHLDPNHPPPSPP